MKEYEKLAEDYVDQQPTVRFGMGFTDAYSAGFIKAKELMLERFNLFSVKYKYPPMPRVRAMIKDLGEKEVFKQEILKNNINQDDECEKIKQLISVISELEHEIALLKKGLGIPDVSETQD